MGVVYRVRTPSGGDAALKVIPRQNPRSVAAFDRERRLLASFGEEDGFVGLLESGTAPGGSWLLMPFVPGGTLRARLAAGPLGAEETVTLGIALARALGAAHARGVVHRDVKPENVLFSAAGRPLLADLGLAKHFDRLAPGGSQSLSQTAQGAIKGTAGYMAPEQLADATRAGPPADVFALGAVLYECLAGKPAFPGETPLEVLARLESRHMEPIGRPAPAWLESVLQRALARDPRERFADGTRLAQALSTRAAPRRSRALLLVLGAGAVLGAVGALRLVSHEAPPLEGRTPPVAAASPVAPRRPPPAPERALTAPELVALGFDEMRAGNPRGAIATATSAIAVNPRDGRTWALRAVARDATNDHDGALADADEAIAVEPGVAEGYESRSVTLLSLRRFEEARAAATRAIELEPGLAPAWGNRAVARLALRDPEGSLADATRALELDPGLGPTWKLRARLRIDKGDLEGGETDATHAVALIPGDGAAWFTRSVARSRRGDRVGELADLDHVVQLSPEDVMGWTNRAGARTHTGDIEGAVADATRAIELAPTNGAAWNNRAVALLKKSDLARAASDATRAIELQPKLGAPWDTRAAVRLEQGDSAGAIADWDQALALEPRLAEAYMHRGRARLKTGDPARARADLTRSLELDPNGEEADAARKLLLEMPR